MEPVHTSISFRQTVNGDALPCFSPDAKCDLNLDPKPSSTVLWQSVARLHKVSRASRRSISRTLASGPV